MTERPAADGTVAAAILRALRAAGATTVFGLPGTHNMAFWAAPGGRVDAPAGQRAARTNSRLRRRRLARASGRLGAALVTTGPGAANTLAAFGEAAMSGSPVVLIASEVPLAVAETGVKKTLHQSKDQAGMFRSLAKASFTPRSAPSGRDDLTAAIETALAPPQGPVYVDIPADILTGPAAGHPAPKLAPRLVDEDALEKAAVLVNAARYPAIWAGGGVIEAGATGLLSDLAAHLQAPVITTFSSRGALGPADPSNVVFPPHEPEVEDLLAGADLLLAFGTDFDGMMTKNGALRLPAEHRRYQCRPEPDELRLRRGDARRGRRRGRHRKPVADDKKTRRGAHRRLARR